MMLMTMCVQCKNIHYVAATCPECDQHMKDEAMDKEREQVKEAQHREDYPNKSEPMQYAGAVTGRFTNPVGHTIGWAVKQLHNGAKICRRGWNGRGMHLGLQFPDANSKMTLPYVYMKTAQGDLVPWLCSQTDLLSADWEFAEVS